MVKTPRMIEGYFPSEPTEYLRLEYEFRKRKNTQYSIRAFARDLNLSPSHLSEFLSGKALLSPKKAEEISSKLRMSQIQREHWNDLLCLKGKGEKQRHSAKIRVLKRIKDSKNSVSLDIFKTISDWYHFAILSCFGVDESLSVSQLADDLELSRPKVRAAIARLIKVGLLEKTALGHRPASGTSFAGDSIPSEAIRESHRQILMNSVSALEKFDMSERESQSLFFHVPKSKLPELREALKKRVLETLSEFSHANSEYKDELSVQTLTWHLFPLRKSKDEVNAK